MSGPEDIERRAERVLATVPGYVWDGASLPVPVEDIADSYFGLLVRDEEDLGRAPGAPALGDAQALSGLLLAARGEIWVNAAEARRWPPRRRFTIGHELGHWVLHRSGQQALFCRSATVAAQDGELGAAARPPGEHPAAGERAPLPPSEEEANAFSAALLMPATLLRDRHADQPDVAALCRAFDASEKAMTRRLATVVGGGTAAAG